MFMLSRILISFVTLVTLVEYRRLFSELGSQHETLIVLNSARAGMPLPQAPAASELASAAGAGPTPVLPRRD